MDKHNPTQQRNERNEGYVLRITTENGDPEENSDAASSLDLWTKRFYCETQTLKCENIGQTIPKNDLVTGCVLLNNRSEFWTVQNWQRRNKKDEVYIVYGYT